MGSNRDSHENRTSHSSEEMTWIRDNAGFYEDVSNKTHVSVCCKEAIGRISKRSECEFESPRVIIQTMDESF